MFDDQPASQVPPPHNLPTQEPEDIFAGVEKDPGDLSIAPPAPSNALSAGVLKKKSAPAMEMSSPPPAAAPVEYAAKAPIIGKLIGIVVAIAVLGGLGYAGWWGYTKYYKQAGLANQTPPAATAPAPKVEPPPAVVPAVAITTNTVDDAAKIKNDSILFGEQADTDQDGIDDTHERQIGTNPGNPDTDGDGLTDGAEVNTWRTDPLNPDTDGDGYPDGQEVKSGYNPLGSGK